jgi:hypothetical protein
MLPWDFWIPAHFHGSYSPFTINKLNAFKFHPPVYVFLRLDLVNIYGPKVYEQNRLKKSILTFYDLKAWFDDAVCQYPN